MTTEEKAKAYDATLKTARQWIKNGCTDKEKICLECCIVELNESEDERIRKEIVDFLLTVPTYREDALEKCSQWAAWLEKQKEQHHEWSLQDEKNLDEIFCAIRIDSALSEKKQDELITWLQQYRPYMQKEQKPAEWNPTNEDVILFNKAITTNTALTPAERAKLDIIRMKFKHCNGNIANPTEWSEEEKERIRQNGRLDVCYNPEKYGLCHKGEWSEEYREEDVQTRFAFYTYKDEPSVLYLSNVFVEEASRNHGFGTRILKAAEKAAEAIGAIIIRLKVKQNSPANVWYRKNGYSYMTFEDGYDWLEKNPEYTKPNKQEWNAEDEAILGLIQSAVDAYSYDSIKTYFSICNWLKSLRSQPKQDWSEEDKEILPEKSEQFCWNLSEMSYKGAKWSELENTAHLIAVETLNDTKFMTTTMGYVLGKLQDIFIAGAKWGAEHFYELGKEE